MVAVMRLLSSSWVVVAMLVKRGHLLLHSFRACRGRSSVLVASCRVLMRDVPLYVVGIDSIDGALSVVPSQPASRAHGLPRFEVVVATARSLVKGAPVARGFDATVVLPLLKSWDLTSSSLVLICSSSASASADIAGSLGCRLPSGCGVPPFS